MHTKERTCDLCGCSLNNKLYALYQLKKGLSRNICIDCKYIIWFNLFDISGAKHLTVGQLFAYGNIAEEKLSEMNAGEFLEKLTAAVHDLASIKMR